MICHASNKIINIRVSGTKCTWLYQWCLWCHNESLNVFSLFYLYILYLFGQFFTRETITSFRWTTLMHPPYLREPSDYHLFVSMKERLRCKHYTSYNKVKTAVMKWLKEQSTEFYKSEIHTIIWRWKITIEINSDDVKK